MKKIRPVKNTSYEWLISFIPEPISALKEKTVSVLKINSPKETVYGRGQKLSTPRKRII